MAVRMLQRGVKGREGNWGWPLPWLGPRHVLLGLESGWGIGVGGKGDREKMKAILFDPPVLSSFSG